MAYKSLLLSMAFCASVLSAATATATASSAEQTQLKIEGSQSASVSTESQGQKVKAKTSQKSPATVKGDSQGIQISRQTKAKVERDLDVKVKQSEVKKVRSEQPAQSTRSSDFWVYSASTTLDFDYDLDGFYSEFTVYFDVDTAFNYAEVYAEMYISRDGGPWIHFNSTDVFSVYGTDSDTYSVTTFLNHNFPTGYYEIVIDIYEAGYSGIVATAGPADFYDFQSLPLEDDAHELNSNDTQITYVSSMMSDDSDRDGFYTELSLEFDIETFDSGRLIYAEVSLLNVDTFESTLLATNDFQMGNQTEVIDLLLDEGYRAGWYDIEIRLIDSLTGEELAIAAQDFSALIQLPLESAEYDTLADSPVINTGASGQTDVIIVQESGGGSIGVLLAVGMLLLRLRK